MAALYDPRYDYPSAKHQSAIGRVAAGSVPSITTTQMLRKLYPDTVGPAALTDAQIHARETEPAVTMFTGADGRLYPAGHPMLTQQNAILSDDTDGTGGYKTHDPTANEISANRRDSIMMNQDPARYVPDGSSLVGNPYGTDENDVVFNSLVERYMSEGLSRDQAFAKAEERMAMGSFESLQTNLTDAGTDALEFVGGIRDDGILSAGKDEDRRDKHFLDAGGPAVPVNEQEQNGPYFPEMPVAPPALTSPSTETGNGTTGNGALTNKGSQNAQQPVNRVRASTGGYTGNARGSGLPDMQIGLGERLMRMGAAGLAAGAQGPLAQMGAMTGAYNDVNQANRQAEMGTFKIEEERRQAHAARVAALAASKNKGAGGGGDEAKVAGIALDNARAVLRGFDKYDGFASPVGWSYWIRKGWDNINGNEQAAIRLKIAKMKVDSTLARVAQTKGAISEKEMDIFMSDQPSWTSDEKVWRDWIDSYIAALTTMHTNLSTGQTPYKNGGGGGSTGKEVLFTAPNGGKVFAE